MRLVTMEVGWPGTGEKRRGWERRKEKGERRKERYSNILLIKIDRWRDGCKDTKSGGGMQAVGG